MVGLDWKKRDSTSPDKPSEVIGRDVVDIRIGTNELEGQLAERMGSWLGITEWRVSRISAQQGIERVQDALFGRIIPEDEKREMMRRMDDEIFGGALRSAGSREAAAAIVSARMDEMKKDAILGDGQRASEFRQRLMETLGAKGPPKTGDSQEKISREFAARVGLPEELARSIVQASGHTGEDDCPACKEAEERIRAADPEAYEEKKRREEEENDLHLRMEVLVRGTVELMRWARFFAAGSVMAMSGGQREGMIHGAAIMTGDMDSHPVVESMVTTLALLLTHDQDFAVFRREKLDGRPSAFNEYLDDLVNQARRKVRAVPLKEGQTPEEAIREALEGL